MAAHQKRPAGNRMAVSSSTPAPSQSTSISSPSAQHAHDRLCLLLLVLVGQSVVVTLNGGVRVQGILSAATTEGELSIALREAVYLSTPSTLTPDSTPTSSLLINAKDLHEIEASDVAIEPERQQNTSNAAAATATRGGGGGQDSFRTDTDISGLPPPSRPRERDLQAWSAGAEAWGGGGGGGGGGGIDDGIGGMSLDDDLSKSTNSRRGGSQPGGNGAWDQFAANERMYGLKTDYDEEIYTTKLDRSTKDFKDREARAAQLEREILKGTSSLASNAHMAEERGEQVDDDNVNEEDRYGAVMRAPGAYVPPGARKAALARLGSTNGSTPSPTPASTAPASTPVQPSSGAVSPTNSRIPPTVRIPTSTGTNSNAIVAGSTTAKTHPPVDETFRDFVREEKERLERKKAALQQQAAKADKDKRLRTLVEFSKSFKNPYPITDEIATMMHGKKATPAGPDGTAKASSTTVSPASAPRQLPSATTTNGNNLAPPSTAQSASPSPSTKPPVAAVPAKKSLLLADIPPFNPAKAAAKQAELAAQKAAKEGGAPAPTSTTAGAAPSTTTASEGSKLVPQPPKSKISATAAPFVFKPNPNAVSFTPGSSVRKPDSVASPSPVPAAAHAPAPQPSAPSTAASQSAPPPPWAPSSGSSSTSKDAVNPFFGTKTIKRGSSSSLNVKEDFTPFRMNSVLPEPAQVVPSWPFTGKPYRSMYPPSATPLSLADEQSSAAAAYQNAMAAQAAMSGIDPSVSPAPQALLPPHHPQHQLSMQGGGPNGGPPPPPPGAAAAAAAMGMPYPGMHPQMAAAAAAQAAVQAAMAGGGGGGAQMGMYGPVPPHLAQQQQGQPGGGGGGPSGQSNGPGGHPQQQQHHQGGGGRYQQQQQHHQQQHNAQHGGGQHHPQHPHSQQQQHAQHQPQQHQMGFPPPYQFQAMGMGPPPQMYNQNAHHGQPMFTSPSLQPQPTPSQQPGGPRYYHPYGSNGPIPPPGSVPPPPPPQQQGFVPPQQQQPVPQQ